MTEPGKIPDAAVRAAIAEHARLLSDRPDQTVLVDETLFRLVLQAALPHLSPRAYATQTTDPYRCPTPCDPDCEINAWGCHETHALSNRREHDLDSCVARTLAANLGWLFTSGLFLQLGNSGVPAGHPPMFFAALRKPGNIVEVTFNAASVPEAAGKAAEWARER